MRPRIKFILISIIITCFGLTKLSAQCTEFYGTTDAFFKTDGNGDNLNIVKSYVHIKGTNPCSGLCLANNGKLYGMTSVYGRGCVIYEWDPDTKTYCNELVFDSLKNGSNPRGSLMQASNGKLYGMTYEGGVNNLGVLFEYDLSTNSCIKKLDFNGAENGSYPLGNLVQADNGKIYGMTTRGGRYNLGVLFEWDPNTDTYLKKIDFDNVNYGCYPSGSLVQTDSGKFYGIADLDSAGSNGILFEWDPVANVIIKKSVFGNSFPGCTPIEAENGNLYWMSEGDFLEWNQLTETCSVKFEICCPHCYIFHGDLMQASNGKLYGTCFGDHLGSGMLFEWDPTTDSYIPLHGLNYPYGPLVQADNGKLYGITKYDGIRGDVTYRDGLGVFYEWDPTTYTYTKIFNFGGIDYGNYPSGYLMQAENGKVYGMINRGLLYNRAVLFEWDPVTSVYLKKFDFNPSKGEFNAIASLAQADNGKLYGFTDVGVENDHRWILFEWDPLIDTYTKKTENDHSVVGVKDIKGLHPSGALIKAKNGKLYGMMKWGGEYNLGTIFEWDPIAGIYTKKIDFNGAENGNYPVGSMVQTNNGKLYGITVQGGANNHGVLFEWDPVTNSFIKKLDIMNAQDYPYPHNYLIIADDDKLWWMTSGGGIYDMGALFLWEPSTNTFLKIFDFNGVENGCRPNFLMRACNGNLYGTTSKGGAYDCGVFFEYDPSSDTYIKKIDFDCTNDGVPSFNKLTEIKLTMRGTLYKDACDSYTSPSGKYVWTESGIYKDTIPNAFGCDSIINVHLNIKSNKGIISPSACIGFNSPSGKYTWTTPGVYQDTIPNAAGCDSVITINLTTGVSTSTIQTFACESYTSPSGKYEWTRSGVYKDTIPSSQGCDSIITVILTIGRSESTINKTAYNKYTSPSGKYTWTSSGTYMDTIPNNVSCDSIITVYLTIKESNALSEFYGIASQGGEFPWRTQYGGGTIFKTDRNGNNPSVVLRFPVIVGGKEPCEKLCRAENGKYYGLTSTGGTFFNGVLFEWDPVTDKYSVKLDFNGELTGAYPSGSLVQADNGKLFGTTNGGGENSSGVIFEWDPSTETFTKKFDFDETINGNYINGSLVLADNGKLYGMTVGGGIHDCGVIFEWDISTDTYSKKLDFDGTESGQNPNGAMVQANNGKLYGMTSCGGVYNFGVLFEWDPVTEIYTKKLDFNGIENGANPDGNLIQADNGKLYGMTVNGGAYDYGVLFEWDLSTNIYTKILDFNGADNGKNPHGSLFQGDNGKLYGMTSDGGIRYHGIVFELDPSDNSYIKKYDFESNEDGRDPRGSLIQADSGKLYGMTRHGGLYGFGVLFKWDPVTNILLNEHDFYDEDLGYQPTSLLYLEDRDIFYGLTARGGANDEGVLFEWDYMTNTYTKKYDFSETNGNYPNQLVLADNGKLYGVTSSGGLYGIGVLFEWDPIINTYTKKIDFERFKNGYAPVLVKVDNGIFYGITHFGGKYDKGELVEWDPVTNNYTNIFDFSGAANGKEPRNIIFSDDNEKIYGVTYRGGENDEGVLFEWDINTNTYTKKLDFKREETGSYPRGLLMKADNGKIYGTTQYGGENNHSGVLFEWDPQSNTYLKKYNLCGNLFCGPYGKILHASNGKYYGTAGDYYAILFEWDLSEDTITKKFDFIMNETGGYPVSPLIELIYPVPDTLNINACENYISPSGRYVWTSSGIYKDTLILSSDKKEFLTINLTINTPTTNIILASGCDYYTSPSGKVLTTSGTYFDTIPNTVGCDSIITIYLTINPSPNPPLTQDLTICEEDSVPDLTAEGENIRWYSDAELIYLLHEGNTYTTGQTLPGTYIYYITQTTDECESQANVLFLTITAKPEPPVTGDITICEGEPVSDLTASGENIRWYSDSVLTILVGSGNSYSTGQYIPGTYTYYVSQTVSDCESDAALVTLTINPLPAIDLGNDTTLYPNQEYMLGPFPEDYSYLWNDGSNNSCYVVSGYDLGIGSHDISVLVTDTNECDNSDTVIISIVPYTSITPTQAGELLIIFPNPTEGFINIDLNEIQDDRVIIKLYHQNGEEIDIHEMNPEKIGGIIQLTILPLPEGIYYLQILSNTIQYTGKLVVL